MIAKINKYKLILCPAHSDLLAERSWYGESPESCDPETSASIGGGDRDMDIHPDMPRSCCVANWRQNGHGSWRNDIYVQCGNYLSVLKPFSCTPPTLVRALKLEIQDLNQADLMIVNPGFRAGDNDPKSHLHH